MLESVGSGEVFCGFLRELGREGCGKVMGKVVGRLLEGERVG